MGILAGIKGVGRMLMGGGKSTEKAIDGVTSGIDKMFYTDEEKADDDGTIKKLKFDFLSKILSTDNDVRSKARREIASQFVQSYLTLILGSGVLYLFGEEKKAIFLKGLADDISVYVGGIVSFYFLYYGIQGSIDKFKNKKEDK